MYKKFKISIIVFVISCLMLSGCGKTNNIDSDKLISESTTTISTAEKQIQTKNENSDIINEYMATIFDALGEEAQGRALMHDGQVEINGKMMESFSLGTHTPEAFIREYYFAVDEDKNVYRYDIINDEYNLINK